MASGTRSSNRKSSRLHSLKKKRRNKDRSKKKGKSGRGKSKKVSRRDSPDSYSDKESSASDSWVSYSSTDGDHRRSRSRTRKDTRRRKEKSRRRRLRSVSSEDSVQVRKRKRSQRSRDTDAKKKRHGMMHRRKPSVSSSSRSLSCSTCGSRDEREREYEKNEKRVKRSGRSRRDLDGDKGCSTCGTSDDNERDHEKTEKKAKRSGRSKRDLDEDRSWHSHRSRSCSSCRSHSDDDGYRSEERVINVNNSRRLKSVITFAKESEEADTKQSDSDEHKEEIVYDHDDYPSPRSNDSNDWETRREACDRLHAVPGQTGTLEDRHKEMVGSNISISKLSHSHDLGTVEHNLNVSTFNMAGVKDSFEENSSINDGSTDADLEVILRQKALENLKKFKGGVRANPKNPVSTQGPCDGEVKESFGLNADSEWKKDQERSVGGVDASSVPHQINMSVSTLSDKPKDGAMPFKKEHTGTDKFMRKARAVQESLQSIGHDSKMVPPSEEGGVSTLKKGRLGADKYPKQALPTEESTMLNMPTSGIRTVESFESPSNDTKGLIDSVDHVNDKHETGASTLVEGLGSSKIQNEMTPIQESSTPNVSTPAQDNAGESLQSSYAARMVTDDYDKTGTGLSTSHSSNLQGQSSNARENEDEDSQFQQKTMSVMRGGEMVQVSYKVHIPKRAPALARRNLKR